MRAVILAGLLLAGCSGAEPGNARTAPAAARDFALHGFTAVALSGPDRLDIRHGESFAVRAEGDAATLDRLTVKVVGDTLRIGRTRAAWRLVDRTAPATIHVTLPALRAATLSGSGDIAIDRADDLVATLAGSGDVTIGQLRGATARLTLAGSGTIAAAGRVERLALTVAGSGDINAGEVRADEAQVVVSGSGDVVADVNGPARVSLTGSGSATLGADARCTVSRTGSGEARCGG